jgi:hypothetical protein
VGGATVVDGRDFLPLSCHGLWRKASCAHAICRYPGFVRILSAHKSSGNRTDAQPLVQFKSFGSVDHCSPFSSYSRIVAGNRNISRRVGTMNGIKHVYEIRPSKYLRTFDLISKMLPLGHSENFVDAAAAVRYAKSNSGSHAAIICVYDDAGNVIETLEHKG